MTGAAKVPHRGFCMGPPPGWLNSQLDDYCGLQALGLDNLIRLDYSNPQRMHLNQAAAWQAMLQAGPYGNRNYGALNGVSFSTNPDSQRIGRSCYNTTYPGDTAGFEWAAVFSHSNSRLHSFHEYSGPPSYNLAGKFRSYNNQPQWTKVSSGGYSGSYYIWTNATTSGLDDDYSMAEWSCIVPSGRGNLYKVEMYASGSSNSPNSYFFLYRKPTTAGRDAFPAIGYGNVNQSGTSGWKLVVSRDWHDPLLPQFIWDEFPCTSGDTLVFRFHPNYGASTPGRCVADAVRFTRGPLWRIGVRYEVGYYVKYNSSLYRCRSAHTSRSGQTPANSPGLWVYDNSPYSITITTNNIFDITNRGANGFRCTNWYNRSFCDMIDDGGPSKVPFYLGVACWINNYNYPDNLGLLYAMDMKALL
jgi:hypothetical protein